MVLLTAARTTFQRFVSSESAGGFALMAAAVVALLIANSPLGAGYLSLLHLPLGALRLEGWINDGLMAVFFLLAGLEIKREMVGGALMPAQLGLGPAGQHVIDFELGAAIGLGALPFLTALVARGDVDQRFGPAKSHLWIFGAHRVDGGQPSAH